MENNIKIRIRFGKEDCMKFVGHLDILRFFQKAIRRADIDAVYSEGFSPHQKMSFAAPLGVGLMSRGEYMDLEIHNRGTLLTSAEAVERLNGEMADGIRIYSYRRLPDNEKNAMSVVAAADYSALFEDGLFSKKTCAELGEMIEEYYSRDNIFAVKNTGNGEKTFDIKSLVYKIKPVDFNGKSGIFMCVAAGSAQNLKPEYVVRTFASYHNNDNADAGIYRLDMYKKGESGEFVSLDMIGGDIV